VRWAGEQVYQELFRVTPSFLRRVKDLENPDIPAQYQEYLAGRGDRVATVVAKRVQSRAARLEKPGTDLKVRLVEYDPEGQEKIIAGMLFAAPNNHAPWEETLNAARKMSTADRKKVIAQYLAGRTQRWQKVGRAFENAFVRFDITINIGAWRDLHRHRMLTQQRQHFTCRHGYDVPIELIESGLDKLYRSAVEGIEEIHAKIASRDLNIAQYAVTLAHRVRFMQWKNLRECFWEMELRSIPEGHPDYRHIEQEKFRLLEKVYPLLTEHMRINMGEYDFARRGQKEKIKTKLQELEKIHPAPFRA
jgi:hypothetical protein